MKFSKYQCPTSCADCEKANLVEVLEKVKPPFFNEILTHCFFKCFCSTICDTQKKLDMRGKVVHEKIGRYLTCIDVPAMLIFLEKHKEITHLSVASNNISDSGFINLIDHCIEHKNIEELDVQNNEIGDLGARHMWELREKVQLKHLNLRANKFGDKGSRYLALFLLDNEHMLSVDVADVNQTASGLIYYPMILSGDQEVSNKTLKALDISRPHPGCMYYFDSAHFADVMGHMLRHNKTLDDLHLQKYGFDCHDIESMMSNAKFNVTLRLLDLGCNNIGDHGVEHVSTWLRQRPGLRVLILQKNIITHHGARSLSYALPFSRLLSLDISYNKITDEGMVTILYTLKKSPLLRQLFIFGNCIGHHSAKIIKRMLISQVLTEENIDVRPYRVDHVWYFARYDGVRCKKTYEEIPFKLYIKPPKPPRPPIRTVRKYQKYTYETMREIKVEHSVLTLVSQSVSRLHRKGCRCCYCLKCDEHAEECRDEKHPDTCTCCKCKGEESSDWSVDSSVLKRIVPVPDVEKNIEHIVKRVRSGTREDILKWININEEVLEQDLKARSDPTAAEESSESTASCKCSWVQLSMSSLQSYLHKSSSKNILIVPEEGLICPRKSTSSSSDSTICSLEPCNCSVASSTT